MKVSLFWACCRSGYCLAYLAYCWEFCLAIFLPSPSIELRFFFPSLLQTYVTCNLQTVTQTVVPVMFLFLFFFSLHFLFVFIHWALGIMYESIHPEIQRPPAFSCPLSPPPTNPLLLTQYGFHGNAQLIFLLLSWNKTVKGKGRGGRKKVTRPKRMQQFQV